MEKRLVIEFHLDTKDAVLTEDQKSNLYHNCMDKIVSEIENGIISLELIESIDEETTVYGHAWITNEEISKKSAIEEIRKTSDKQIIWRNKPFPPNHLMYTYGKYCDYNEESNCIVAYLKSY
jgi:hypothetical protein